MQKNIFSKKKRSFSLLILIAIFFVTIIIFLIITNPKDYFIVNENVDKYYIIPKDRGGEKVKYLDKKSINNLYSENNSKILDNIDDLNYTIQIYANNSLENVEQFLSKFLNFRKEILELNEIYVFNIVTELGDIYYVSYKNFSDKNSALNYCYKLSFIDKCLVLNLKN
tara:strand:- start:224 stop:727 length:504 start_codon:yes stop_codon:yes gene_type:complete